MNDKYIDIFKREYTGNEESLQSCLKVLKHNGCTQMESVRILMNELGLSLSDADKIVLNSEAWQDTRQATINLRNLFRDTLKKE